MAKEMRPNRRRLVLDIRKDLYDKMRISAIKHNCTMTKWMHRVILGRLQWEDEHEDR